MPVIFPGSVAGPLAPERVAHVLSRVAEALTEAHDSGLIHRDIKPANIFLCRQGGIWDVPKVLDFGLVKQLDSTGDLLKTQANAIVGTPHYMSPEAIKTPDEIDARSDIYALGAVGYYLLTGEQVFDGDTVVGVCLQHLDAAPVPPSERAGRELPAVLERIVLDCLAKRREDRPQSALELAERLRDAGLGRWDARQARAWWSEHEHAVRLRRSIGPPMSSRTLAVDPAART